MIDFNKFLVVLVLAALAGVLLYGLDRGFLTGYHRVRPGQVYAAPQHGEIHATQATLVCRYLSLDGTHTRVLLESDKTPDCPFWLGD
jgi:hypothetical protein